MTIPTIQLKLGVATPAIFVGGGAPTIQGNYGTTTAKFDVVSPVNGYAYTAVFFDTYEDGAPMANGRSFQASHSMRNVDVEHGPYWKINRMETPSNDPVSGNTATWTRINAPICYVTDDECWTCFYWYEDIGMGTAEAWFFKGRFQSQAANTEGSALCVMPAYTIPVFIDDADLAATTLTTAGSSVTTWSLASTIPTSFFGVANQALCAVNGRDYTLFAPTHPRTDARRSLAIQKSTGSTPIDGTAVSLWVPYAETTTGDIYFHNATGSALRCYRREDASAIYDWPGIEMVL